MYFSVLKFWLSGDWKGKKWPKMTKMSVTPYISGTMYHMIFIYGTHVCIKGQYLQAFFSFFFFFTKFWLSRSLREGKGVLKGQKITQNNKKICLSHCVYQELYIIGLWFLVHMCKMMIPLMNFFVFQSFDFWGF